MIISDQRARKVTISQMMSYFEYDFNVWGFFSFFSSLHFVYTLYIQIVRTVYLMS